MRLDDAVGGDARGALEAVDVLREEHVQQALAREQGNEDVRGGRAVAGARVELAGEHVEGFGVLPEEGQVEDGLGLGQVERGEVGVEACFGGAEVGDWKDGEGGCEFWSFFYYLGVGGGLLPAAVEMPAPVMTTMRRARPDLMCPATAARLRSGRVRGGVSSDT